MNAICVIPARGGSKGIEKKNLQHVNNKSLLSRTIEKSKFVFPNDRIFVSSDDEEILVEAQKHGVNVHTRSPKFSSDDCSTEDSLLSFLDDMNHDAEYLIFAQCTAPFFMAHEFQHVLTKLGQGYDSAFTVYPCHSFQWEAGIDTCAVPLLNSTKIRVRRQDLSQRYIEAGSVYGMAINHFEKERNRFCGKTALNIETDGFHFEIDVPRDLALANFIAPYFDENGYGLSA